MNAIEQISVVIIVKNGEQSIKACLESLAPFGEVVVFDNGSTDATREIAGTFGNVRLVEGVFQGFGPTRNAAAEHASKPWVLALDCDELLGEELLEALKNLQLESDTVYEFARHNYYRTQRIRYAWGDDVVCRLYNTEHTRYDEREVHESVIKTGMKTQRLHGHILHYSFHSVSEFIDKTQYYSTLFAKQNRGKKSASPLKAFGRALFFFIKSYILKRGFLDGYPGLLICVSGANGVFYKYMKLYEENL